MNVRVSGYAYVVDLGTGESHIIYRGLACSCGKDDCPSGDTVVGWVNQGLVDRAPIPPAGFTPYLPKNCPVCGGKVKIEHSLSSRTRGIGWRCETGPVHYWQTKWELLKPWFFREQITPGVMRNDIPEDKVVHLGYLPSTNK